MSKPSLPFTEFPSIYYHFIQTRVILGQLHRQRGNDEINNVLLILRIFTGFLLLQKHINVCIKTKAIWYFNNLYKGALKRHNKKCV